jgi:hypothetical protein
LVSHHDEPRPAPATTGPRNEARAAVAAVYGTFTEGFMTPDLVDAAAQLNGLA